MQIKIRPLKWPLPQPVHSGWKPTWCSRPDAARQTGFSRRRFGERRRPDVLRTCSGSQGLCSFSDFSLSRRRHWCEALQSSIYLQMRVKMAATERSLLCIFNAFNRTPKHWHFSKVHVSIYLRRLIDLPSASRAAPRVRLCTTAGIVCPTFTSGAAGLAQPAAAATLPGFLGCSGASRQKKKPATCLNGR